MESISKQVIERAEIPAMSPVLQRVLALTNDPNASSADLEKLILQEPGLIIHILKLVNSAYYGLQRKISSLTHAISILGFSTIKSLASGLILYNLFKNIPGLDKAYISQVWDRCLKASAVMKILSAKESLALRDDLFLSAMIHDVGHLILKQYFKETYRELIEETPFPDPLIEQEKLETDHTEVGSDLLSLWRFPEKVTQLIRFHHLPADYPNDAKEIYYLVVCDHLSEKGGKLGAFLMQNEPLIDPQLLEWAKIIDWPWSRLQAARSEFQGSIQAIAEILRF